MIDQQTKDAAQLMLQVGKQLWPRGTVKDLVTDGKRFAFVMAPTRMAAAGVGIDPVPFTEALAVHVLADHGLSSPGLHPSRHQPVLYDFLEALRYALPMDEVQLTIIPEGGWLYPAIDEEFYSAKSRKMIRSEKPDWLLPDRIQVFGGRTSLGIDFCKLFEPDDPPSMGKIAMQYGRREDELAFVTHAFNLDLQRRRDADRSRDTATSIRECGGLLFPSLGISHIPAIDFGSAVLFSDVALVLNSLKPRRKRGMPEWVTVYGTDAWTERTSDFHGTSAVSAFEQMHGWSDYMSFSDLHVWPLGAPLVLEGTTAGMTNIEVELIKTESQLRRDLRERARIHHRQADPLDTHERYRNTKHRYPVAEAKSKGILPLSYFPICICPERDAREVEAFLQAAGFEGDVVDLSISDQMQKSLDGEVRDEGLSFSLKRDYAFMVADAAAEVSDYPVQL